MIWEQTKNLLKSTKTFHIKHLICTPTPWVLVFNPTTILPSHLGINKCLNSKTLVDQLRMLIHIMCSHQLLIKEPQCNIKWHHPQFTINSTHTPTTKWPATKTQPPSMQAWLNRHHHSQFRLNSNNLTLTQSKRKPIFSLNLQAKSHSYQRKWVLLKGI